MEWMSCLVLSCPVILLSWLSFLLLMWLTGCVLSASGGCEMCVMCFFFCVCVLVVCVLKKKYPVLF